MFNTFIDSLFIKNINSNTILIRKRNYIYGISYLISMYEEEMIFTY